MDSPSEQRYNTEDRERFRHSTLDEQLDFLRLEVKAETLPELLLLCSELADSAPLLFLVEEAQKRGIVMEESLGEVLLKLSTPALHKLLQLPGLEHPVRKAWTRARVEELVSFALLDRYLRRRATGLWKDCLKRVVLLTQQKLESRQPPDERLLLRLQGTEQKRFRTMFPEAWSGWSNAWDETAQKALQTLAARPRDVSLANAERLLSQQVYTDQGHFLLELLQNADDAGASLFEVEFRKDAVIVSHNGVPFDFRDLVGVLSIGQTTKTERQIGYFGVGFKSVFEVTERPRLYSGHFAFEIIDISVPRYLPTQGNDPERTTLFLPLKPGLEIDPYFKRALEIEPTLLLNLPNVQKLRWIGPDGIVTELSQSHEGDVHSLTRNVSDGENTRTDYLVWKGRYQHRGTRPEGKPNDAQVMLAFPQEGDGTDIPGGNLYSFLPIQEDSGLRFLIGSHFDVPVDRERLDQTSRWNRGLLRSVPEIILQQCQADPSALPPLLKLLPLPGDTVGPLFRTLSVLLSQKLRDLPFLPDGENLVTAGQAVLLEPALAGLYSESELASFLQPSDDRTRTWLELLGATTFNLKSLLREIVKGKPPERLLQRDIKAWQHFHKSLLQDPSFETWEAHLKTVPLLLDEQGRMAAAFRLTLLSPEWEDIFETPPPTVWKELRTLPETNTLIASLEIKDYDWPHLVARLKKSGLEGVRPEALFQHLVQAPRHVQLGVLQLPLYRSESSESLPLTAPTFQHEGLYVTHSDTPRELFEELRFCDQVETLEPLLEAVRWPWFDRSQALAYLTRRGWQPTDEQADTLCRWLLERSGEWATLEDLERLSSLPIFCSEDGRRRPLNELWRYEDAELEGLMPHLPQLQSNSLSGRVVDHFSLQHLLGTATLGTLIECFEKHDQQVTLSFLSSRAEELSRQQISRLLKQPIYQGKSVAHPDHPASESVVEVAEPELIALFQDLGQEVASLEFSRAVVPLLEAAGFKPLGLKRLVELLQEKTPPPEHLKALHDYLAAHAVDLHLSHSESVLQSLHIWLCEDGKVRSAREIPSTAELAQMLEMEKTRPASGYPEILSEMIPFLEPAEFLVEQLKRSAVPKGPLESQPVWLNSVKKVDRLAPLLSHHHLCVAHTERLADERLHYAPPESHGWLVQSEDVLLHPESSEWQIQRAPHMRALNILERFLPFLQDREMRTDFYRYLGRHLGQIVREKEARRFLLEEPIWLSSGGNWNRLEQLVLEGDLPELGYDWSPHSEIPKDLLDQLKSTLDVGRSDPESLLKNLLMSYQSLAETGETSGDLLKAMARVAEPLTGEQVRSLVEQWWSLDEFPIYRAEQNDYVRLGSLYAPPDSLSGLASPPPVESQEISFLRKVGLAYLPPVESLQQGHHLTTSDGKALEELIAWAWEERPAELQDSLSFLRSFPWVRDGAGEIKAPVQLYLPTSEIQELIGTSPNLYPLCERPAGLWRALGIREERDLTLTPVLQNLQQKIERKERVSSHFYGFLEHALQNRTLTEDFLKSSLSGLSWVWTDEGEYRPPNEVVGMPAYRYFGTYRGTWERAPGLYPLLTGLFDIPASLTAEVLLRFLQQVALGQLDTPSVRLIRNCLSALAEQQALLPRDWKVLPAREWPGVKETLVAASQKGVFRSNSPTLAALFGQGGTLWVTETDDSEHGGSLEALYERLGVPRLRDSYTIHTDSSGTDLTQEMGDSVSAFRKVLGALVQVLPRLRAARPELDEGEWLADTHLKPFATAAPINVIDELLLVYTLPDVSTVRVSASLAYDPEKQRLLVSAPAIQEPQQHAVELAEGLVECIYQGPGSESLIDLLNLLLLFGNERSMNSYLDQRHFPRPSVEFEPGSEAWRIRLGEILDYGLHQVMARRHPELREARWEAWRDQDWHPARGGAEECLHRLGVDNPSPSLVEELQWMLDSPEPRLPTDVGEAAPQPARSEPRQVVLEDSDGPAPFTEKQSSFSVARFGKKLFNRLNDWLAKEPVERTSLQLQTHSIDLSQNYQHPPNRHLLVSDKDLQLHNLYCLEHLCSDFDQPSQEYRPGYKDWKPLFLPSGRTVQFTGSFAASSFPLPRPLYSKLTVPPAGRLSGPDEFQQYRLELDDLDTRLHYEVELSAVPDYQSGTYLPSPDPRLLAPTVALEKLPAPVRDWIDWGQCSGLPHWQLAERAKEFVMGAYQYDLNYTASHEVQQVLKSPYERGENKFLSVLHAGASGRLLGRGVCVELSALLLEVLRHCKVPCSIAKVWMLDQGLIHVPDHVVVLALVPTPQGPFWLPLDPSTQRIPAEQSEPEKPLTRLELLEHAARIHLRDLLPNLPAQASDRQQVLEQRLLALFGDQALLELFLECLAKPGRYRKELTEEFEELRVRGFLDISTEELYQVWVRTNLSGESS